MKIVTTPMCEEIVRLAGVTDYVVNKFPDKGDGDLAILLSESKVEMDAFPIKINTPAQVFESIREVSRISGNELADEDILAFFDGYDLAKKYHYHSHTFCNVCDTCKFEKLDDNRNVELTILYHRGVMNTTVKFANGVELNDLIIFQNGDICYDWNGENNEISTLFSNRSF